MAARDLGDEEAQSVVDKMVNNPKVARPAWFNHNGETSAATFTVSAALLVQLLSGYESVEALDNISTISLCWILFLVYSLAGFLMVFKRDISGSPTEKQKIILMSLNLLTDTAFMIANVFLLRIVHKSYLGFVSIPVLGFILVALLFFFNPKLDQNQGGTADDESMVKSCFMVGNVATSAGYLVQTTVCIGYMKYPIFRKDYPDQYILILAFLTSCVGSFARTLTSSPLQFQNKLIRFILMLMTYCMLVLLGLAVLILSAEFIDEIMIVLSIVIPFCKLFMVNLCQKYLKQKATEDSSTSTDSGEEVDSMFGALVGFGTVVLSAVYSVKFLTEGHTAYLTWSVFFFLLSTISSLIMGTAFLFHHACTYAIYQLIDRLLMVEALVGLAFLLKEISAYITKVSKAGESVPLLSPMSSLHH